MIGLNEAGWDALGALSAADRAAALELLFRPADLHLSMGQIPIGSGESARGRYFPSEVDGDYEMEHFTIERDEVNLIPYVEAARAVNPELRFWAVPWTPPPWMKTISARTAAVFATSRKCSKLTRCTSWPQNALLVVHRETSAFYTTPAYHALRHLLQFLDPGVCAPRNRTKQRRPGIQKPERQYPCGAAQLPVCAARHLNDETVEVYRIHMFHQVFLRGVFLDRPETIQRAKAGL